MKYARGAAYRYIWVIWVGYGSEVYKMCCTELCVPHTCARGIGDSIYLYCGTLFLFFIGRLIVLAVLRRFCFGSL